MQELIEAIGNLPRMTRFERVARMEGLAVEVTGAAGAIGLGGCLRIAAGQGAETPSEVHAVRGILDGHIILDRWSVERGRPSRTMPHCNAEAEQDIVSEARAELAIYEDTAELIRLGAYRSGTNPDVDRAIALNGPLEAFLKQERNERADLASAYATLNKLADGGAGKGKSR